MRAVHDYDIELRRGDFAGRVRVRSMQRVLALTGPSGVGKTSVLHALAGLLRPVSGHITIDGECLFDAARRIDVPAYRRRIGYVFQDARLFPHLDVRANLLYARPSAPGAAFDEIVGLLGIGPLLARRTTALSGGERQRVALGRALLSQPRLLLLDEPLSALDLARRAELLPYFERVRDELRLPIIYVSHAADEVERMADEVVRLEATASACGNVPWLSSPTAVE